MTSKGQRVSCAGGCGRRVLLFYNPSFYCRKCAKKNALKALKLDNKKKKEAERV